MRATGIVTAALAVGIGTTRLVETVKESIPIIPPPAYRSAFASVIAGVAGAVVVDEDWRARALTAAGAAGIAMITHEVVALLSATTDRQKVTVMRAATR